MDRSLPTLQTDFFPEEGPSVPPAVPGKVKIFVGLSLGFFRDITGVR